jgi:hypothetical protein
MDKTGLLSKTKSSGSVIIKYLDETNEIKSFSGKATSSASSSNKNSIEATNESEKKSINQLLNSLDSFKNKFNNIVNSEISTNSNTLIEANKPSIYEKYIKLYYFAYPYLKNNEFILKTKLPSSDPNYLKLNEFNYATNVSPLIISPNYDVLYFPAVLDLTYLHKTNKSIIIKLPANIKNLKKYYVLQFIDLFTTNFFYISSKSNTSFITEWELVAPDYKGQLKENMIKANSWYMLILGRIEVDFRLKNDLERTIELEKQFKIVAKKVDPKNIQLPDSSNLKINDYTLNITKYYNDFVKILQWQTYFTPQDRSNLNFFETLGIYKNNDPFYKKPKPFIPTNNISLYKEGSILGQDGILFILSSDITAGNNWGTSANAVNKQGPLRYLYYTLIAWQYTYGNNKDQAVYYSCYIDSNNNKLNGKNNYSIDVNIVPPVNLPGFWSITAYTIDGYVEDDGQKYYTVGQNIRKPCKITLSNQPSPDPQSNVYLQVPKGDFYLLLRMYSPISNNTSYIPNYVVQI